MIENWKRILSALLCLCMIIGMMPNVPVWAEGEEGEPAIVAEDPSEPESSEPESSETESSEPESSEKESSEPESSETESSEPESSETESSETESSETESSEPESSETTVPETEDPNLGTGSCGTGLTWALSKEGTLTISGKGEMASFGAEGAPWKEFAAQIVAIEFGSDVASIGSNAFAGCTGLKAVTIPGQIAIIGSRAFASCSNLKSIAFTGDAPAIAEDAFSGVQAAVSFPEKNTTWKRNVQLNYGGTLTWNDQASYVNSGSLNENLTWAVNDQNTLVITGTGAIPAITTAPWAEFLTTIKAISLDSRITAIGTGAFAGCTAVAELNIPAAITNIGASAFSGDTAVKTIAFAGAAPKIGTDAFKGITANVSYPVGDHSWVPSVMQNYGGQLTWQKPTFGTCGDKLSWELVDDTLTITGTGTMTAYASGEAPWASFASQIKTVVLESGMTTIGSFAFAGLTGLSKVELPGTVTTVGASAFAGCTGVTTVVLPASLKTVGSDAFSGCAVENLYVAALASWMGMSFGNAAANPISNTAKAHKLYINNEVLTELTVPEGTAVPAYAFTGTGLTKLTVGKCASIGENAFTSCGSLKEITFTGDAPTIASNAFTGVTANVTYSLANATWTEAKQQNYGGQLTWLGTVSGTCGNALTWTLDSNGALVISGTGAMTNFTTTAPWAGYTVKTVTIGENVETIGGNAFKGNTQLASITIPAGVTSIGSSAFAACSGLKDITFQGDAPKIADSSFASVTAAVHFPENNATWTRELQLNYGGTLTWNGKPSYARSGSCGEKLTWAISDANVLTISGTGAMTDFGANGAPWAEFQPVITSIVLESGVTTIGSNAFANCTALKELTIPANITAIGASAFSGCSGVKTVAFAGAAPKIGTDAFKSVTANVSYDLAASGWTASVCQNYGGTLTWLGTTSGTCGSKLTWTLDSNGALVISGTGAMTEFTAAAPWAGYTVKTVTIAEGVTTIGSNAFKGNTQLAAISIPIGVTSIGAGAFASCGALRTITFAGNAPKISDTAFTDVTAAVTYPADNATWTRELQLNYGGTLTWNGKPSYARSGSCGQNLTWAISDANVLTISGTGAMTDFGANGAPWAEFQPVITSIVLESGVTTIGSNAFAGCTAVTALTIPANITAIGASAFSGCTSVKTIAFAGNAPKIGTDAFKGITANVSYDLTASGWTASVCQNYGGTLTWLGTTSGTCGAKLTWTLDSTGALVISGTGTMTDFTSGKAPWAGYTVKSVSMPEGMTSIGAYAFSGCADLTEVTIPAAVVTIGAGAFENCTGLGSISIPTGVKTIAENTFRGCTGLTEITVPGAVTAIGASAFAGCTGVKTVTLPASLKTLGNDAFSGCAVENLYVASLASWLGMNFGNAAANPISNTAKAHKLYVNNELLTELTVPEGVAVPAYAFTGTGLTKLTVGKCASIGENAFTGCGSLKEITFTRDAPAIAANAFTGVTANVSYNLANATWTEAKRQNYGGKLTWLGLTSGTCGTNLRWQLDSNGLLEITGTGAMSDFTSAPWSSFSSTIKTVTIAQGVTTIGKAAFANCTALPAITIPASVTAIGAGAFENCTALKTAAIPSGVKAIADKTFQGCTALTGVEIPTSVTSIGASAFSGCSSLSAVTIPAGVTAIADSCFANCAALKAVTIPDNVTSIGASAFSGCTGLTAVVIPGKVTTIGASAFAGCSGVKTVTLPESLKTVGASAFSGCSAVETLNVATVESWLGITFANASSNPLASSTGSHKLYVNSQLLKELVLADTVKTVPVYAFYGCADLTSVTFGTGVTAIGDNAFGKSGVKTMVFTGGAPKIADTAFTGLTAKATYPLENKTWTASFLKNYGGSITWQGLYKGTFGELTWQLDDAGVLTISGKGSMNEQAPWKDLSASVVKLVIEEGVTDISKDAFRGCKNMTSVKLPASMRTIGQSAFRECTALVSLDLGGTVTISDWAFYKCTAITTVVIPAAVTTMGTNAFRECTSLVNLDLGKLTDIADWAFYSCTSLAKVTIPNTVRSIGSGSFRGCTALAELNLGKVLSLGEAAFYGCTALTKLTVPSSMETLGKASFGECSGLTEVTCQGGETIVERAFYRCTALKTMILSKNVASVGPYAFDGCSSMEVLVFQGDAPAMDKSAFAGSKAGMQVVFYPVNGGMGGWANAAYKDYGGKPAWLCWVEVSTEEALTVALRVDGFKVIRVVGNVMLTSQLTIPAGKEMAVIGTLTLVSGASVVNNGTITVGESGRIIGYRVTITNAPAELRSGAVAELKAEVNIANVDEEKIVWSLNPGDEEYALLSGNQLLAKDVTEKKEITLTASTSKGHAAAASQKVLILPVIKGVKVLNGTEDITGSEMTINVNAVSSLKLRAVCDPADSISQILWSSSSDICTLESDTRGNCTVTLGELPGGKSATVKLIAKDAASSKAGEVILHLVAAATDLEIESGDTLEVIGGQSYTFKSSAVADEGTAVSDKTVVWTMADSDSAYASITTTGKLTTKSVGTRVYVTAVASLKSDPSVSKNVRIAILPVTAAVEIVSGGKAVENMLFVAGDTLQLDVNTQPADASKNGTWKSSSTSIASVDENGRVTFKKNGKVTITFTAADGSKKKDTAVLLHGIPVSSIEVTGKTEVVSGSKITLKAVPNSDATLKGLTWSSSDPDAAAVSSIGIVAAKTVYEQKTVIITVAATDGSGTKTEVPVIVSPKASVMAVRDASGQIVNGKTLLADVSIGQILTLSAEPGSTWSSSNTKIATVSDGTVEFKKAGSVTITAKSADGKRSGKVTVKGTVPVEGLEITAKGTAFTTAADGTIVLASGKGKVTLAAVPTNADAAAKTVTWISSDPTVASVTKAGAVSAKAGVQVPTEVTITATASDGSGKTAVQKILVNPLATHVSIASAGAVASMNLAAGEAVNGRTLLVNADLVTRLQLSAMVYPAVKKADVTWETSDPKLATVEDGVVTIQAVGSVTITAVANDGSGKSNQVKLYIGAYPASIEVLEEEPILVSSGGKITPNIHLTARGGYDLPVGTVRFSLRPCDAEYASVSESGEVTAKKVTEKHDIVLTVASKADPSVNVQISITVIPAASAVYILRDGEVVNGKTITASVGSTVRLSAAIDPIIAAQNVTWSVSGSVATVDQNGNVTGVKAGTVTITAKAADGSGKIAKVIIKFA